MNWIFDAHIHLSDEEYESDMPFIINCMEKMHIKACSVSENYDTSIKTLELGKKSDLIFSFIGTHPQNSNEDIEQVLELVNSNSEKISGIGEIGLDKTYEDSDGGFQKQKQIFTAQLSLAEKLKKPVSIHSRKALDEIYEIIPSYSIQGMLLHWFDGNKKQLQKAMDLGFFVSFGPVMIYANDKQVLLSNTDRNKILVETDGPVKFSKCFGLKPAQISFIPSVIFCASKVLRVPYNEFCSLLEENSKNFLGI